jgi:hypothetical protein
MAIRSTETTAVTNDLLVGPPENLHHTHSQVMFIWLKQIVRARSSKKQEAKLQRVAQIPRPLQMASVQSSAEYSAEQLFSRLPGCRDEINSGNPVILNY